MYDPVSTEYINKIRDQIIQRDGCAAAEVYGKCDDRQPCVCRAQARSEIARNDWKWTAIGLGLLFLTAFGTSALLIYGVARRMGVFL